MNLEETLEVTGRWIDVCSTLLNSKGFESSVRSRVSVGLLHLSIEHHRSIHFLTTQNHHGSSFALLRPQFESYIRGLWFFNCASEKQLESFLNDDEIPRINTLITEIENSGVFKENKLQGVKEKVWREMCGYTHGGYFQVANRNTENDIVNDYPEDNLVGLITVSNYLSYLALVAFARFLGNDEEILHQATTIHKEMFNHENA